jgi:pectinesterase
MKSSGKATGFDSTNALQRLKFVATNPVPGGAGKWQHSGVRVEQSMSLEIQPMKLRVTRRVRVVAALTMLAAGFGRAEAADVTTFPANNAVGVNPDTHLVLTLSNAPALGKSGQIRIYDAAGHKLVDTLDLSIPAGPDASRRITAPVTLGIPLDSSVPTSPTTTTPAVRITPADLHNYQLTTIGGLENFHFYPVIIHGNVATIYPHNRVLRYGHKYIVQIDPGVLIAATGAFAGFMTDRSWTFRTKPVPPPANIAQVVVAADGSGDFNTVQGAVDFIPDLPLHRVTIFIKQGTYEEIVFCRNKSNLTFRGEDREKVQVGYANNSAFNPPQPGPNRRSAFSVYESTDIELINFSVNNYAYGQAEGLLLYGSRIIVSHMNIQGSGDALNLRGPVYLTDSRIGGDGDTILGVGPAFFNRCEFQSIGPFMWIRNTEANHGNVFMNCTFITRERSTTESPSTLRPPNAPTTARLASQAVLARLPNNHGLNYPYAEAVLINCRLKGIPPVGWGPIEDDTSHLHLWEFSSTDLDGHSIDVTKRHPVSKQLTLPLDAETINNYSNPSFVLDGWTPIVEK